MTCITSSFHYLENTCPNPPLFSRGKALGRVTPDEDHTASRDLGYKSDLAGSRSLFFPYLRSVRREILGMAYFGGLWGGQVSALQRMGLLQSFSEAMLLRSQTMHLLSSFLCLGQVVGRGCWILKDLERMKFSNLFHRRGTETREVKQTPPPSSFFKSNHLHVLLSES